MEKFGLETKGACDKISIFILGNLEFASLIQLDAYFELVGLHLKSAIIGYKRNKGITLRTQK